MAAIGQPLLGDGVRAASRRSVPNAASRPAASASSSTAVRRAGSHDSASSARAAHLPAHSQLLAFVDAPVAPHGIGGVGKAVHRRARQAQQHEPENRRDHRVVEVFGQRLDGAFAHLRLASAAPCRG